MSLACTQGLPKAPRPALRRWIPTRLHPPLGLGFLEDAPRNDRLRRLGRNCLRAVVLQGNIEMPHKFSVGGSVEKFPHAISRYMYDLGFVARIIIGALAASPLGWRLTPRTPLLSFGNGHVAVPQARPSLRSASRRLLAAIAVKEAAETKAKAVRTECEGRGGNDRFLRIKRYHGGC